MVFLFIFIEGFGCAVQVANGLRIYFDKALRHILLYAEEMEQANKVLGSDPTASANKEDARFTCAFNIERYHIKLL